MKIGKGFIKHEGLFGLYKSVERMRGVFLVLLETAPL